MSAGDICFNLQVAVSNLGVTEAFYSGILDLPVIRPFSGAGSPDHLILGAGCCTVIFLEDESLIRMYPGAGHSLATFPKGVGVLFRFKVIDLVGIYDALTDEGLDIAYYHEDPVSRAKELWVYDPDGYLVVLEEPHDAQSR